MVNDSMVSENLAKTISTMESILDLLALNKQSACEQKASDVLYPGCQLDLLLRPYKCVEVSVEDV